jgi:hypothetical protein
MPLFSLLEPMANSSRLVLPTMIAPARAGRLAERGAHIVFDRQGHARKRPGRLARGQGLVNLPGPVQGPVGVEADEGLELIVVPGDALEGLPNGLGRGQFLGTDGLSRLGQGHGDAPRARARS